MKNKIIIGIIVSVLLILVLIIYFTLKNTDENKNYVKEIIGKQDLGEYKELFNNFNEFDIYDVTPKEYKNFKLFKSESEGESFLIYNNKSYGLGMFYGGYGLIDSILFDIDNDKKEELVYTYSWGSGLHRSHIGIFDFDTLETTNVDYELYNGDMMLSTDKKSVNVYSVEIDMISFTNYLIRSKDYIGKINYDKNVVE